MISTPTRGAGDEFATAFPGKVGAVFERLGDELRGDEVDHRTRREPEAQRQELLGERNEVERDDGADGLWERGEHRPPHHAPFADV